MTDDDCPTLIFGKAIYKVIFGIIKSTVTRYVRGQRDVIEEKKKKELERMDNKQKEETAFVKMKKAISSKTQRADEAKLKAEQKREEAAMKEMEEHIKLCEALLQFIVDAHKDVSGDGYHKGYGRVFKIITVPETGDTLRVHYLEAEYVDAAVKIKDWCRSQGSLAETGNEKIVMALGEVAMRIALRFATYGRGSHQKA